MKIGYARVSTYEQNLDLQLDALNKADCEEIYTDKVSGVKDVRPNWEKLVRHSRQGDVIVTWRLDRIGRGHNDLLQIVADMEKRGVNLQTLTGIQVDTSTPTGKLFFRMAVAMIEYERELIIERTRAGLDASRARGHKGGRKKKLNEKQEALVKKLSTDKSYSPDDICKTFHISRSTYFRTVRAS